MRCSCVLQQQQPSRASHQQLQMAHTPGAPGWQGKARPSPVLSGGMYTCSASTILPLQQLRAWEHTEAQVTQARGAIESMGAH